MDHLPTPPQTPAHPALQDPELERLARRRAGAKLGWYIHAAVYLVVNITIGVMALYGVSRRPWTPAPLLGWGLGLALHGVSVFVLGGTGGLRERMVQRERERLQRERESLRRDPEQR